MYDLDGIVSTGMLPSSGHLKSPSWILSGAELTDRNGTKSVGEDLTPGLHSTFTYIRLCPGLLTLLLFCEPLSKQILFCLAVVYFHVKKQT